MDLSSFAFFCLLLLFIIILGFAFYNKGVDDIFSPDLLMLKHFYNSNEINSIKKIIKENNLLSQLIDDKREKERKKYTIYDKNINKKLENILINKRLKSIMEKHMNNNVNKEHYYPIELRLYDSNSQGLRWHVDKALFYKPYYECVLTLENDSYSMFQYLDTSGRIHNIIPKANTLICVTPNSIPHGVTPTLKGKRLILKFVVTFEHNRINQNNYNSEYNVKNIG